MGVRGWAVGGQTTEDLEMQFLLPDLDIFSEATKLKKMLWMSATSD